ncbi:hypothetical protein [Fulvimonas soli]|uniref:hypothetical protein n=1 Tax=Fulvimonas soli TaxID=155197 RepID=UPI00147766ED|nr:hypothetical protein [Fulvimonas soli]
MKHISPEEAVAHIQDLLQAKRERVRQGPNWPGAAQQARPDNGSAGHVPSSTPSPGGNLPFGHNFGDRGKD